ncbi:MAG: ferredoxin [Xanthomonadaceae bacterium]|nr:ferredoxin [Rhodospirillaceae bacterium]NIA18174.1 ferredoxin [Xanthomonadaceae bacterium]
MPKINKDVCIGCGTCASLCPEVFELSDAGKAKVKENAPEGVSCIQEAIDSCPVQAISK